jgi:hypothetical protein
MGYRVPSWDAPIDRGLTLYFELALDPDHHAAEFGAAMRRSGQASDDHRLARGREAAAGRLLGDEDLVDSL